MLAKGNRSRQVTESCRQHGGFYLGSIGGAAARLALDNIKQVDVLEYPELGMEAVWKIDVVDFPAFIVVDDKGNDFFEQVKTEAADRHVGQSRLPQRGANRWRRWHRISARPFRHLVPLALLGPVLGSALGIDGGAIFQIFATEDLGLSPTAIGIAFGLGVLSVPVQIWAARMPLWRARRNLQTFLVIAAVQAWILAVLVATGTTGGDHRHRARRHGHRRDLPLGAVRDGVAAVAVADAVVRGAAAAELARSRCRRRVARRPAADLRRA